jgi:hypothetical protein
MGVAEQTAAFAHAEALALVTSELIRYGREGAAMPHHPFGCDDLIDRQIEALHFTLTTELAAESGADPAGDNQLLGALTKWLSDNGLQVPA